MDGLTKNQIEILTHTLFRSARGMFCGDSEDMKVLVEKGLMRAAGRVSWVPDEYFKLTDSGKDALAEILCAASQKGPTDAD